MTPRLQLLTAVGGVMVVGSRARSQLDQVGRGS